jgi:hypothetical protein
LSFVAAFFLLAQFFSAIDAAEYGGESHQHDGTPCAFQFLTKTAKGMSAPAPVSVLAPSFAGIVVRYCPRQTVVSLIVFSDRHIRGPPPFLF